MKKIITTIMFVGLFFTLSGCWNGEISVNTQFNSDGSGTRTLVLDVMDDTLSSTPIINPDDPDQTEGKGPVVNNEHITGGIPAIETWLQENAPSWMTVEAMTTDGIHRYFTLTYDFTDFADFTAKYEELVGMSPNVAWSDFDASELPSWSCSGSLTKTCTFTESKDIVQASLDWAIAGIWNDLYDATSLAGYVTKDDIATLANYTLTVGNTKVEDLSKYDPSAVDGDYTGKVVYVQNSSWTASDKFTNKTLITEIIIGAVVVIVGLGVGGFFVFKKQK